MAWPSTLPLPTASGYGVKPLNPILRTEMEVGAARTRRRTFARNDRVTVEWIFTDAEMAVFRAWFDDTSGAAGGGAWFSMSLALGTGGIHTVDTKFFNGYEHNLLAALEWHVSAQLEVR